MLKSVALVFILVCSQTAFGNDLPRVQLANTIEIDPEFSLPIDDANFTVTFRECKRGVCHPIGEEQGYSIQFIKENLPKARALGHPLDQIIENFIRDKSGKTFADLDAPFKKGNKVFKSTFGYGGSLFLSVIGPDGYTGKVKEKESEYVVSMLPEQVDSFIYFPENESSISELRVQIKKFLNAESYGDWF